MNGNTMIDEKRLEAAADELFKIGKHNSWWKLPHKTWRDMDSIGREEFLDVVWTVVNAYNSAPQQAET